MASCRGSFRDFVEQAFGLLLQREDIGGDQSVEAAQARGNAIDKDGLTQRR